MKYQVYKDKSKQFRWRLIAKNGKIIAESGEAYKRWQGCMKGLKLVNGSSGLPVYWV